MNKAKALAQGEFPEYPIGSIIDIGVSWAFGFDTGKPAIPGIPFVCVDKRNGQVSYLTIPPLENLEIISKGTPVKL